MCNLVIISTLIVTSCATVFAGYLPERIPIEEYKSELQDLGEEVKHHEIPPKVITITRTVAVKVPIPYAVKIREKVPYPVHVPKPYPVYVPHVVKAPEEQNQQYGKEEEGHSGYEMGHNQYNIDPHKYESFDIKDEYHNHQPQNVEQTEYSD